MGDDTPSLGVPVIFSEISNAAALCEFSCQAEGFMPELSYGSHLFQDMAETGIFYAALLDCSEGTVFNPDLIRGRENTVEKIVAGSEKYSHVVHVAATPGLVLYSDILSQMVICQ